MFDLVLKNLKLLDYSDGVSLAIEDGKIAKISKSSIEGDKEIDLNGQLVLPGLIDPHVHFRDPGLTYKEDFRTGSMAAAHGGFTFVMDMPNTVPKTNTYKAFKEKQKIAESKSVVNFGLHAGYSTLEEMEKILELNPMSFKVFMDLENDDDLDKIFEDISNLSKKPIVTVHAEKRDIVLDSTEKLQEESEAIAYSYGRPAEAEDASVLQAIELSKKHGVDLHICHLSTRNAMNLAISNNISFEFTPHHLLYDNTAFNEFGTLIKTNPPLREKGKNITVKYLDGNSMIGTDHAPHSLEEKTKGVWDSSPGIPSLETVLSLLLTEVNRSNLDLNLIPKIFSENAAKRFNLENKGFIKEGFDADLVVVDLNKEGVFDMDNFYTKAEYSPFDGLSYKGKATMTIVNGEIIMEDDVLIG
ncbi:dihydroorotase family protein [Methanobrevibacter sp.]|uniref:dihydroorotase n=1 Tax=Methanobrevibacter sp. TaxID=66852 RepID=UPI0025F67DD2|nr:dihydroorotase family protein [Methanobrevibacter sp.]MBQ2962116.1 dihydroorotase family protein [Methanobrevibacter sp.]